jgi:precorrin-2/cobalt-factor-2 C20-methyltransferase
MPPGMIKTSVYLPDDLKAELAAAAARSGRSEAETIRWALERFVRSSGPPPPDELRSRRPTPSGPRLVGVGVGPGDPDLLTGRAVRILEAADRVFAASISPDAVSRAEAVVYAAAPGVAVERLVLHVGPGKKTRRQAVQAAAERIASCLDGGELVAFATLGDPRLFSPFPALADAVRRLRPAAAVDGEPGILAFQQLAATTATTIASEGEQVTLVTLGDDPEILEPLLQRDDATIVIYKGGRRLPEVAAALADRNRLAGAVAGELLGQPGERCLPLAELATRPGSYLATAIIPARRGKDGTGGKRATAR